MQQNPALQFINKINHLIPPTGTDLILSHRVAKLLQPSPVFEPASGLLANSALDSVKSISAMNASIQVPDTIPPWFINLNQAPFFNTLSPVLERAAAASARLVQRYSKSHWDFILCLMACESLHDNDQAEVEDFTTDTLLLPKSAWSYVAEVLLSGAWRAVPEPLRFIRTETLKIIYDEKYRGAPKGYIFMPFESLGNDEQSGQTKIALFDKEATIHFRLVEGLQDAVRVCARAGIPKEDRRDSALLLLARFQGFTRAGASTLFGWSPQRVEALWRALTRVKKRMLT
jgi:hypothetical protein